jgi:hypothetical protein
MINMYAYTYPAAKREFLRDGFILAKVGVSHREAEAFRLTQIDSADFGDEE